MLESVLPNLNSRPAFANLLSIDFAVEGRLGAFKVSPEGKKSRDDRLLHLHGGQWGTFSADLVYLVGCLYRLSFEEAKSHDGNYSKFPYAGIPLLPSALQSFVIEYESLLNIAASRPMLEPLAFHGQRGLLEMLRKRYKVDGELLKEAEDLIEVRNEIVHPIPVPAGTAGNCPAYLQHLKSRGLLESTGKQTADFGFFAQLASHRLFAWACRVTRDLFKEVAESDGNKAQWFAGHVENFNVIGFEGHLQKA